MICRGGEHVLVHGITGKQGSFWAERMQAYGTRIVGGVNPRKAGTRHLGVPVWDSARTAARETRVDVSLLFVPPLGARDAILDAVAAGVRAAVVVTEHIPVQDVMYALAAARDAGTRVVGPNTAGLVTPGSNFIGFMPAFNDRVFQPGRVGVISRSGSLGTLICLNLTQAGYGISAFVGVGGDPILGTTPRDAVGDLDADPNTEAIVLVGEIGGAMEEEAAERIRASSKPVASFIAGAAAPQGTKMGHAGAITMGSRGTYPAKKSALEAAGVSVVPSPSMVPGALADLGIAAG